MGPVELITLMFYMVVRAFGFAVDLRDRDWQGHCVMDRFHEMQTTVPQRFVRSAAPEPDPGAPLKADRSLSRALETRTRSIFRPSGALRLRPRPAAVTSRSAAMNHSPMRPPSTTRGTSERWCSTGPEPTSSWRCRPRRQCCSEWRVAAQVQAAQQEHALPAGARGAGSDGLDRCEDVRGSDPARGQDARSISRGACGGCAGVPASHAGSACGGMGRQMPAEHRRVRRPPSDAEFALLGGEAGAPDAKAALPWAWQWAVFRPQQFLRSSVQLPAMAGSVSLPRVCRVASASLTSRWSHRRGRLRTVVAARRRRLRSRPRWRSPIRLRAPMMMAAIWCRGRGVMSRGGEAAQAQERRHLLVL